jgi:hypothetical protein
MDLIVENAKKASIGGASRVRPTADRQQRLYEDQIVGQICHYAGAVYLTGNKDAYVKAREEANRNPLKGDCGSDIPGLPVDIKGSLMRAGGDPMNYRLLVRPMERHPKHFYVLALLTELADPATVYLVGYARECDLPAEVAQGGQFGGAHVMYAEDLRPMDRAQALVRAVMEKK